MNNVKNYYSALIDKKYIEESAEYMGARELTPNECYQVLEDLFGDNGEINDLIFDKIEQVVKENDSMTKGNKDTEIGIPRYEVLVPSVDKNGFKKIATFKDEKDARNFVDHPHLHSHQLCLKCAKSLKIILIDNDGVKVINR